MKKIRVKIEIKDYIIKEIGIIKTGVIKVKDKDDIITFDTDKLVLTKENKDLKINMDFRKKKIVYTLKPESQKFSTFLTINSLTNRDKQVIINYRIEKEDFLLKIEYETI